jgi:hypothetical protein
MSYSYQLFNQDFISSELIYLPLDAGINKIITCNDLLGRMQWSNIEDISVSEIKSSNSNLLINGVSNEYKNGQIEIALNDDITINNITVNSSSNLNQLTGNLQFLNNINLSLNNINYVNNITARQYLGEFLNINKNTSNDAINNVINGSILCDSDGLAYNFINNETTFLIDDKPVYSTGIINTLKCHINFQDHINNPMLTGGFILNQLTCDITGCNNVSSNNFFSRLVGYEVQSPRFYSSSNGKTIDYIYGISIENNPQFYGGQFLINYLIGLYIGNNTDANIYNKYGLYIDANNNYINGLRIGNNNLNLDNNNIDNINYTYSNRLYIDDLYEKTASNNIKFNNTIDLINNNILNCNDLNSVNLYGEIKTTSQPSILTLNSLIRSGNLDNLNSNNITPYNVGISLGSSISPFHSLFLDSTLFNLTTRSTYLYIDHIFENTVGNKIIIYNDLKLNGINIIPYTNNTSSIGEIGNIFNNSYINNSYTNNIYEATNGNNVNIMNNTSFNNNNVTNINSLTATNIYGDIKTGTQNYITVMNNLINAGSLHGINSNNIYPHTSGIISLGTSSYKFLNAYFSGTIFTISLRTNNIFESTTNNGIIMNNNVILNNTDILPYSNNTCNLGSSIKLINQGYITNLYTSLIGSVDLLPITIINDTSFNNNYASDIKGIKFYNESNYLNSYVESSFSLSYSFAWSGNITVYYVKVGKNVTLIFPSDSISRSVSSNYLKLSTIPAGIRPLNSIFGHLYGSNNSSSASLSYVIQNDGIIYIGNSITDIFSYFTSGTVIAGFYGFSISYRI